MKKRDHFLQHQEAGKQEKNQMGLLTMDDGVVNWGEHTEVEETNHALMAYRSSNEIYKDYDFKELFHPLVEIYTPKPQEEIDDSLYVYGKKGPQKPEISVSDDNSSEHSTCQSNDSEGSCGNTSEHSFETESESLSVPNEMSKSSKNTYGNLQDKKTHKVNRKNWNDMMERELGEGYSFTKKKCFVCGSLNHLIKDCDYYEKKMAREAEVKRVVNTGNGVAKPVWTNANRINHSNKFVPRSVQLNVGRPKFNSVRPNINTGRTNINSGRTKVNAVSSNINTIRSRQPVPNKTSNSTIGDLLVKTSASYNWRNTRPNFNYNSGPTFVRTVNANGPQGRPKPVKAWMPDENQILLKVPRHHNMYSFDMKTPTPAKGFACLIAKATYGESKLWHRRLDLPHGMKVIGTKWVYRNKRDERGVVVRNKARLVAQGYTQEEGIDYDEVFDPVARIEAIRLFLAFASFMGFIVFQMDVKSAFLYGTIDEEVYFSNLLVLLILIILQRFIRWSKLCMDYIKLLEAWGQKGYHAGSSVTPKTSHLNAVKRIFKYLKGKPNLGLWYPRESPFDLEAFSDSDYGGSNLDRKSTTGGCHFLTKTYLMQCKNRQEWHNMDVQMKGRRDKIVLSLSMWILLLKVATLYCLLTLHDDISLCTEIGQPPVVGFPVKVLDPP
ncbi:putative ribonuclease H-like domain-containing protein [Tanacetum coccineum]|uniref:Ribonuclease H-like domain-containing protein n=1 Tax=Tanacetum coccineum TaxID=301880 RepID=A0ABQ5G9B9_9ASTR